MAWLYLSEAKRTVYGLIEVVNAQLSLTPGIKILRFTPTAPSCTDIFPSTALNVLV